VGYKRGVEKRTGDVVMVTINVAIYIVKFGYCHVMSSVCRLSVTQVYSTKRLKRFSIESSEMF